MKQFDSVRETVTLVVSRSSLSAFCAATAVASSRPIFLSTSYLLFRPSSPIRLVLRLSPVHHGALLSVSYLRRPSLHVKPMTEPFSFCLSPCCAGKNVLSRFFLLVAKSKSQEAFLAVILLTVIALSSITEGLGLSGTLGAFLAGTLLADTKYTPQVRAGWRKGWLTLMGSFCPCSLVACVACHDLHCNVTREHAVRTHAAGEGRGRVFVQKAGIIVGSHTVAFSMLAGRFPTMCRELLRESRASR